MAKCKICHECLDRFTIDFERYFWCWKCNKYFQIKPGGYFVEVREPEGEKKWIGAEPLTS